MKKSFPSFMLLPKLHLILLAIATLLIVSSCTLFKPPPPPSDVEVIATHLCNELNVRYPDNPRRFNRLKRRMQRKAVLLRYCEHGKGLLLPPPKKHWGRQMSDKTADFNSPKSKTTKQALLSE